MSVLHVANGDAFAARLREGDVKGSILSWGDMLSEGPLVHGLRTEQDWRQRALGLDPAYGIAPDAYVHAAMARLAQLDAAHDETVLWFDEDLFCQVNAAFLIDHLATTKPGARVSIVSDPVGLADVPVGGLRALHAEREAMSPARAALARRFWAGISGPDPSDLVAMRAGDLDAWPQLADGIRAHMARFPSAGLGLTEVEETLMTLAKRGTTAFGEVFIAWQQTELGRRCGFGDLQVALTLARLAPLVDIEPSDAPLAEPSRWRVGLSPTGREALAGRAHVARPSRGWVGGARADAWRRDGDRLHRA